MGLSRRHIIDAVAAFVKRLETFIGLYQIHDSTQTHQWGEHEGTTRFCGVREGELHCRVFNESRSVCADAKCRSKAWIVQIHFDVGLLELELQGRKERKAFLLQFDRRRLYFLHTKWRALDPPIWRYNWRRFKVQEPCSHLRGYWKGSYHKSRECAWETQRFHVSHRSCLACAWGCRFNSRVLQIWMSR